MIILTLNPQEMLGVFFGAYECCPQEQKGQFVVSVRYTHFEG